MLDEAVGSDRSYPTEGEQTSALTLRRALWVVVGRAVTGTNGENGAEGRGRERPMHGSRYSVTNRILPRDVAGMSRNKAVTDR